MAPQHREGRRPGPGPGRRPFAYLEAFHSLGGRDAADRPALGPLTVCWDLTALRS